MTKITTIACIIMLSVNWANAADDFDKASNAAYCVGALNLLAKQNSEVGNDPLGSQLKSMFENDTRPRLDGYRNYVYGYAKCTQILEMGLF
jgi:hypothetical protein